MSEPEWKRLRRQANLDRIRGDFAQLAQTEPPPDDSQTAYVLRESTDEDHDDVVRRALGEPPREDGELVKYGRPVTLGERESFPDVTTVDTRPRDTLCMFCQRDPRRLVLNDVGYRLCPWCCRAPQDDPLAPAYWVGLPGPKQRGLIIARFNIDPVTWRPSRYVLQRSSIANDADGMPVTVLTEQATRVPIVVGVPHMWWHALEERGAGIATPPTGR